MEDRILTIPNLLTFLRILLLPVFLWFVIHARFGASLAVFFLAGISDGLDGLIARRFNQKSRFGQVLDPIADKLLLTVTFLVLTLPGFPYQPIPIWLTGIVILRDIAIVIAALVIKQTTGFSDFKPSQPGKWNTTVLLTTVLAFLLTHTLGRYTELLIVLYILSLGMTIFSGLHYIYFINIALKEFRNNRSR